MSTFTRPQMEDWFEEFTNTMEDLALSPLVVIAAISGHAPAGGAVIATMTDYRIAQEGKFLIGLNEVRVRYSIVIIYKQVGLPVPSGIVATLRDVVGPRNAQHMAMTGMMFSPEKALQLGFADEVVPAEKLIPRSKEVFTLEQFFRSDKLRYSKNG